MIAIEHSSDGRIVTLTLNRPDKRNALNQSLVVELTNVIESLSQDPFVRVLILTGAGDVFSAGADLKALSALADVSPEDNLADSRALESLFLAMRSCPKFVLGRINGHAIAGGAGLVLACDASIASDRAKLGFTEVKIGFVPALVSALLIPRVSETGVRDLLLSGRLIPATEAKQMNLITQVVPHSELDEATWSYARNIARNTSSQAIASTKKLLGEISDLSVERGLNRAAEINAEARSTSDCKDGVSAFLQKKDTPWVAAFDADHPDPA